jgi:glycerol-1-phosphate dehydrogenase [NAD(P)+]
MTMSATRSLVDHALASASTTREVAVSRGALSDVGRLISENYPGRRPVIVADERTFEIAGREVQRAIEAAGIEAEEPIVLPGHPTLRPDMRHVQYIRAQFGADALPVAVGSGTINDLTKRASFEAGLPYIVVATAPSMDGYTASGAALVADGVKQTFECPAPEMVIADLDILRNAPSSMIASGYGDLVGKITAGADWILADALGIEPIIPDVWTMVQAPLRAMIADPERFFRGDVDAIEQLFQGLVITGLAIQAAGTTRTASGSEHQFSHLWEMRGLTHEGEVVSHGKKVALGTIVSETLYDRLLSCPIEDFDVESAVSTWPSWPDMERTIRDTHDHPMLEQKALEECGAKYVTPDELRSRLLQLKAAWPELKPRLREQLLPLSELRDMLATASCPTTPEQIGLTREQMRESYLAAGQIRRRYTVFDILLEAGLLHRFVDELFAPGGYWSNEKGV